MMEYKHIYITGSLLAFLIATAVTAQSNINDRASYFRSLGKLCGWAQCQGLCQYRDEVVSPYDYYNSRCSASIYNEAVYDSDVCNDAICITHSPYSGLRRPCRGSSMTQTVCYSLYRNASTNRVQTRVCWDQSPNCMDLVNFCKVRRSVSCIEYSSVTTLAPVWTLIPQGATGPPGATGTTPLPTYSKNSSMLSTISSSYPGTPTAEANKKSRVFISGAVSGICAAAIPMIIAVLIFLLLKRRHRNQFQVSDASKRNESLEMMDGPVYASIGPELPIRQDNLVRGDISSSARSLHCSAPRRTNLLGNLQRNKSLPALAYEINSLPMERNDILRTVSMANRLSGLSEPPSSPLSPNQLGDHYTPDKASKNDQESPCTSPQTPGKQLHGDTTRHIPSKNGATALTNIIYDEAILSAGPTSKYSESDEGPNQDADPNRLRKASEGHGECRPYTTLETDPHITPSPEGKHGGHAQYANLELNKSLDASTTASYTVLVTAGDAMSMETGQRASPDNKSQKHVTVIDGTRHAPQYMELDKGRAGAPPPINEYMGIAENTHQPTGAYMGLETNTARETNHYLGIGDGPSGSSEGLDSMGKKHIPINAASGAYAELSPLNRGNEPQGAYMGLNSPDLHVPRKASEASIDSYVGLQTNLNSGPPVKKQHDHVKTNKRKFWKSKSTFHKRKETSNGLGTTYEGLQTKSKRSFLFRNKKSKKPPPPSKDMCLDLNLSSPPPTDVNPAPQYFTLELDASSHPRGKQQGSSYVTSVPEYQEPISEDDDEPFRLRSQSQPTRHGYSTGLSEDYEMITDDWGPANFQQQPHK